MGSGGQIKSGGTCVCVVGQWEFGKNNLFNLLTSDSCDLIKKIITKTHWFVESTWNVFFVCFQITGQQPKIIFFLYI